MWRWCSSLVAATIALSMLVGGVPSARAISGSPSFYVSLGDSLSVGYQPGPGLTRKGYVDDLWRSVRGTIPGLQMRKLGCPGATGRSMITGEHSICHYAAGSQLRAAVAFLEGHAGAVPFITIDVGLNDVARCFDFDRQVLGRPCVMRFLPRISHRLTHILDALRAAAGPDVPILGMTIYDPLLGLWGLVPHGRAIARKAQRGIEAYNAGLTDTYQGAGAVVADVAKTYRIDDFADTVVVHGRGRLPLNVALTCRWTWFCSRRFAGDPHPTDTGYRRIAHVFYRRLQPLLP